MIDPQSELGRLRSLDSQTVGVIFDRYFPEVFRYARYRLGDELLAEDIASEVFVRLLEAVRSRRGPETNLRGWLIATANHMVTDALRGRYRHPTESISDGLPDDDPEPVEQATRSHETQNLRLALGQLTGDQQHVLALRFGQGCSLEETAVLMKKKVNAVKALQFRALNALQKLLKEAE